MSKNKEVSTEEIWRVVEEFPVYKVSNHGNVKRFKTQHGSIIDRPIKKLLKHGYHQICFCIHNKKYYRMAHRVVAVAFLGNPDKKPYINHIDGNKINNHVSNLEWCTSSENIRHALRTGLMKPGKPPLKKHENHNMAKLTANEVKEIRALYKSRGDLTHRKLAKMFSVSKTNITDIINNKIWVGI